MYRKSQTLHYLASVVHWSSLQLTRYKNSKNYIYLRIFLFLSFSATIYPIEARFKAKAPVITIEVVQNSKDQPDSSKTAIPKREEIEDISFLRSGKGLKISFGLKQTNI